MPTFKVTFLTHLQASPSFLVLIKQDNLIFFSYSMIKFITIEDKRCATKTKATSTATAMVTVISGREESTCIRRREEDGCQNKLS